MQDSLIICTEENTANIPNIGFRKNHLSQRTFISVFCSFLFSSRVEFNLNFSQAFGMITVILMFIANFDGRDVASMITHHTLRCILRHFTRTSKSSWLFRCMRASPATRVSLGSELLNSSTWPCHLSYIRSCQKRKGRLRLAEATVAAAQPREIMALVTAVHL